MKSIARAIFLTSVAATPLIVPIAAPLCAQTASKNYSIPAQDLGDALREFAVQSGQDVVFNPALTAGKKSKAVRGTIDANQALRVLLNGSGLSYATTSTGFAVRSAVGNAPVDANSASSKGEGAVGAAAQGESAQAIVVTGSRLDEPNRSVPLKAYTAQQIEESGATTVASFLNRLPAVSVQSSTDRFSATDGQTNVRLHGFPAGTTEVLLNGRRLAPSADVATDFDLSALPIAFIERIDILPSGSSAIYGSNAIAGVVNFITKRNVSGVHLSASVGHAADYTEQNYSAAWGKIWDRGSVSVVASYDTHGVLFGGSREIIANADYRRFAALGGVDQRGPTCDPGNIFATTAANLPGLTSTVAAIPSGVTGRPTVGDFIATQGTQTLCAPFKDLELIPAVDREGILASGHFEITPSVETFAELLYTHAKTSNISPLLPSNFTVPASNAFNPFGVGVVVKTELEIPSGNVEIKDFFRPLVGLRGKLFSSWHWEIALWRSQDNSSLYTYGSRQAAPLAAALASGDPTTAINPFSSTHPGPASVLAGVYPTVSNLFRFDVNAMDATLRGQLFRLPAGPVSVVIGGEFQSQIYFNDPRSQSPTNPVTDVSRRVGSVYSELRLPILRPLSSAGDLLDVTFAGRYDHYSDFGSKATPQVGVEVRPAGGLLLRASYAQAFKAPQLDQLYAGQASGLLPPIPDNGRPGNPITSNVLLISGGNRHLRPETGDAYSVGAVWSAGQVPGLTGSLDYWWLAEDNRISRPSFATVLGNPAVYPGRAVRDANGLLLSVDTSFVNFGSLRAQGFDFDLSYRLDTAWGEFSASADWVRTTKFTAAVTPGAALVDRLGQATQNDAWAVKDKATLGFGWRRGGSSLHATVRYLGPYRDYITFPANTNRLGDYALFDLNGRVDLRGFGKRGFFHHAALTASVVNLFDKSPQYSNFSSRLEGYDPTQADILGRLIRVGLTLDW
jgi:iron complex outermembrane recepter protein